MKVCYVEVQGFRAYGPAPQRLEFAEQLVVVHADNSHGKTSLVEALECLFSGATTRRLLLGGSASEFTDALRNAHLEATQRVYVELGLATDDGISHVLRRELTCDYRGATDCVSVLTLDGTEITDVASAGLQLSDPPLSAPVLLEHTLRYAVSAKPGERSDYFKAVLEVSDLDVLRQRAKAVLAERERAELPRVIKTLQRLTTVPKFVASIAPLRTTYDGAAVTAALHALCDLLAPAPPEATSRSLAEASAAVQAAIERRQARTFPLDHLSAPAPPPVTFSPPQANTESVSAGPAEWLERTFEAYREQIDKVDKTTATMLPILDAALNVNAIHGVSDGHPVDCPLCLAPGTLDAARIKAIRSQLAQQQGLTTESKRLASLLSSIPGRVDEIVGGLRRSVPEAVGWTDELRKQRSATAAELAGKPTPLADVLRQLDALDAAVTVAEERKDLLLRVLQPLAASCRALRPVTDEMVIAAGSALADVLSSAQQAAAKQQQAAAATATFSESVRPRLEAASDTTGWAAVAFLAAHPQEVEQSLLENARRNAATKTLRKAIDQIEAGTQQVLDQRLRGMDQEIRRWWELLRPSELTTFDAITRRGSGQRFLDVKAALATNTPQQGVVRNALAVLSTSQLNALGLAAFLARCQLLASPLVVLDDPVPGSDREHRNTFANGVIGALLDENRQVLVCTHDPALARSLQAWHQHRGVTQYQAQLTDPVAGTMLRLTGDAFEALLLDAQDQMHSPLVANRRAAGNSLRIATERLAKHVVVAGRRRDGDATASIEDYEGKNLGHLGPKAHQYACRPNEPGQWTMLARVLNDADHDADPPQPTDLKQCHASLKAIKRDHLRRDPLLMAS